MENGSYKINAIIMTEEVNIYIRMLFFFKKIHKDACSLPFQERFIEVQSIALLEVSLRSWRIKSQLIITAFCILAPFVIASLITKGVGISPRAMKGKVLEHFRNIKLFLL